MALSKFAFRNEVRKYTAGNLAHSDEGASHKLNPRLGSGKSITSRQTKVSAGLDKAIESSAPLRKDTTLYRGAEKDHIQHRKPVNSYVSGTDDPVEATNYTGVGSGVVYKIKVTKGSKALKPADHEGANTFLAEGEHVLPRGSSFERGKSYPHPDHPGIKMVELKHRPPE